MPSGGGTSQTAVNRLAGSRTQLAELVTAAVALLTMLFLAPLIGLMPQATLAAVVLAYSIGLIKPADFRLAQNQGAPLTFYATVAEGIYAWAPGK